MTRRQWKREGIDHKRLANAEKRDRQRTIAAVRKLAGLKGRGDPASENYLLQIAKHVDRSTIEGDWNRWRRREPHRYSKPARDRVRSFFYWLTEGQLSAHDAIIADAYIEVADQLGVSIDIERDDFRGYGDILFERLDEFLADAGNTIEDATIDYLLAIFRRGQEWKPAILSDPKVSLGRYGWKVWNEWILEQGGRSQYLRPTHEKQREFAARRELVDELHDLKSEALEVGGVDMLDEVGKGANGLDEHELRAFIDRWREKLANAGSGRRGSTT